MAKAKTIKLKDLMQAMEEKLAGIYLLMVLRSVSIGEDEEKDASDSVISSIRKRLDEALAEPSDDDSVNKQIQAMSDFLKEYE